jgi:hypothetical protein
VSCPTSTPCSSPRARPRNKYCNLAVSSSLDGTRASAHPGFGQTSGFNSKPPTRHSFPLERIIRTFQPRPRPRRFLLACPSSALPSPRQPPPPACRPASCRINASVHLVVSRSLPPLLLPPAHEPPPRPSRLAAELAPPLTTLPARLDHLARYLRCCASPAHRVPILSQLHACPPHSPWSLLRFISRLPPLAPASSPSLTALCFQLPA